MNQEWFKNKVYVRNTRVYVHVYKPLTSIYNSTTNMFHIQNDNSYTILYNYFLNVKLIWFLNNIWLTEYIEMFFLRNADGIFTFNVYTQQGLCDKTSNNPFTQTTAENMLSFASLNAPPIIFKNL